MKRVLTAVLTFVMAFSVMTFFTACGDNNVAKEGTLSIKYYEGGYGYEWIEDFAARFKAQTGKEVAIERSTNVATTAEDEMSSGNAYDIYISHGMPIFRMAARGLLADLTDVYESDIEGTKFEQRVIPAAREMAKFKVGGAEKYVMVPYTQGVGGLVYNKTMFAANKWKVPETYAELVALCATINGTPGLKDKNGDKVTPFVWSNALSYMWDYVVCDWWAQMSGINKVNEFFEYEDYTVYNPDADYAAFKKAYKLWTDLIVGNKAYSNGGTTLDKISSQATFAAGGAAMMPNAHWLYNEMKDTNIEFEMAFMNTPRAPEALDDTDYNYLVGFGDAMAVPACAVNLDLAKEFLKFCAKEENCAKFTKMTNGAFFAYDYSGISLEDESDPVKIDAKAVEYVHSIKAKLDNSTCYNVTSKAQIAYMTTNKVGNWPNNEFYYTKAYDTAGFSDTTIDNWFKSIYTLVKTNWPNWERSAGLKN